MTKEEIIDKIQAGCAGQFLANEWDEKVAIVRALRDINVDNIYIENIELPEGPEITMWQPMEWTLSYEQFMDILEESIKHLSFGKATCIGETKSDPNDVDSGTLVVFKDETSDAIFALDASWYDQVYCDGDVIPSPFNEDYYLELIDSDNGSE